jgi:hypothetical protein
MNSDLLTIALGPFWSNSGTRTWSLLLARDRVIAWPYTFCESLQLSLRFQFKVWPRDPGEAFRLLVRQGLAESGLPSTRHPRRYHVHLLRSIVIQSNNTANTVTFEKLSGEMDEYAIPIRQETDDYRAVFSELYPDRYHEKDFPTSAIGRLLRI